MQNRNLDMWLSASSDHRTYGDELMLYALCKQWHHHAMVICKDRNWSTLEPEGTMDEDTLIDICDLCFLYVKPGVFTELTLKPSYKAKNPKSSSWADYSYTGNTSTVQDNITYITHLSELENFVESINWTPEGITIQTTAQASTSTPLETIELDARTDGTISLDETENEDSILHDSIDTISYAETSHVENNPSNLIVSYDYSSDILNESELDEHTDSVDTKPDDVVVDKKEPRRVDSLHSEIKREIQDFTDFSNSGFLSDGGTSTVSQYQTPSKLKTLSFRALRGEDKWPTPSLKWISCIAVGKLDGNYLHLDSCETEISKSSSTSKFTTKRRSTRRWHYK